MLKGKNLHLTEKFLMSSPKTLFLNYIHNFHSFGIIFCIWFEMKTQFHFTFSKHLFNTVSIITISDLSYCVPPFNKYFMYAKSK